MKVAVITITIQDDNGSDVVRSLDFEYYPDLSEDFVADIESLSVPDGGPIVRPKKVTKVNNG